MTTSSVEIITTTTPPQTMTSETPFGSLRSVTIDGKVWFVAADVCRTLGIQNTADALSNIDRTDVNEIRLQRRGRPNKLVSESGLYDLVLQSRKKTARAFRRHLTSEVIPSLHKHGVYVVGQENMTDAELRQAVNTRGERLVEGTRAQRHQQYAQEIARIEEEGRKATSWERHLAKKP
ncbi:BRO-N domain-containing protein [Pontibaca salina]|uniref:Bro-N domain-containing protein n=1 Tax=Pontibaca salina TaxID=2795731 RepID=A0A934HKA5_9RHOB|nr:BRO family protein [Pontibaca salina]MBI6629734.1 hypothetical protein [Pontibaca salina]